MAEEWASEQTPNVLLELSVVKGQSVKFPVPCGPTWGSTACDQDTDQAAGNLPEKFDNTHAGLSPFNEESPSSGVAAAECHTSVVPNLLGTRPVLL